MKHTKEPWEIRAGETRYHPVDIHGQGINNWITDIGGTGNAKRIVACVNACAGIKDPATAVPMMLEALAWISDAGQDQGKPNEMWFYNRAMNLAREALAKAKEGQS